MKCFSVCLFAIFAATSSFGNYFYEQDRFEKLLLKVIESSQGNNTTRHRAILEFIAADEAAVKWIKQQALVAEDARVQELVYLLGKIGTLAASDALEEIAQKGMDQLARVGAISNLRMFRSAPWNPTVATILLGPVRPESISASELWIHQDWSTGIGITAAVLGHDDGDWGRTAVLGRIQLVEALVGDPGITKQLSDRNSPRFEVDFALEGLRLALANTRSRVPKAVDEADKQRLSALLKDIEVGTKKLTTSDR